MWKIKVFILTLSLPILFLYSKILLLDGRLNMVNFQELYYVVQGKTIFLRKYILGFFM